VHDVEILEGLFTLHQTRELQRDAMHMVRHLQARIEVKQEVMDVAAERACPAPCRAPVCGGSENLGGYIAAGAVK